MQFFLQNHQVALGLKIIYKAVVKITVISDLHVKSNSDKSYNLLLKFLKHKENQDSNAIFLLGDIFDFMMGGHREYLKIYEDFFKALLEFLERGKEVHFFEGNHDFHLEQLFKGFFNSPGFYYHYKGSFQKIGKQKIYFEHGDDLQIGDPSYKFLKFVLRNKISKFLFNNIFPFSAQQSIAEYFSDKSRKRGLIYIDEEKIREKFRKSAQKFWEKNKFDIICGHSHCMDDFQKEGRRYINNGYPLKSGHFIIIDEKGARFNKIA